MKKVAIVGRPNVGKSTLFNRLINKKRAITDPTSGVTRDIIMEKCYFSSIPVLLCDTAGLKDSNDNLDMRVYKKSIEMLKDADVLLFTVSSKGWCAEDEEILSLIRPFSDKTILVVNKIDTAEQDNLVYNFYSHGLERVVGISSSHARGIDALEEYVVSLLEEQSLFEEKDDINSDSDADRNIDISDEESDEENENKINVSIMGKPNTGKSTLMNLLCKKDLSIVSLVAGTTRDTVDGSFEYKDYKINLVDTAGIRRKAKVDDNVEYYSVNRAIKSIDSADVVILMIDADMGFSDQDKKIAMLAVRKGCGIILCLNKIDKFDVKNQLEAVTDRVRFLFPILSFAPIVGISALEDKNITKLLDTILMLKRELIKRVSTAAFNASLKKWAEIYTPPRSNNQYYKILYGTQVEHSPVRFLLFVNKKKGFPEGYISFIKNKIRQEFGFSHIPVDIVVRERSRTNDEIQDKERSKNAKRGTK